MMSNPQLEDGYTRIANELLEQIAMARFSSSEYSILIFIIRQTYGYGHKTRYMTASYIAEGLKTIPYSTVEKVLPNLKSRNVIIQKINKSGKVEIGINKDFRNWQYTSENGRVKTEVAHFQKRKSYTSENGRQLNKELKKELKKDFFEKNFILSEMIAYADSEKLNTDVEAFYLYNEGRGWKGVEDWKPMLKLWAKSNPLKEEESEKPKIGSIKPWKECDGTEWQ